MYRPLSANTVFNHRFDLNTLPAVRHLVIDQVGFAKVLPRLRSLNKIDTISFPYEWVDHLVPRPRSSIYRT